MTTMGLFIGHSWGAIYHEDMSEVSRDAIPVWKASPGSTVFPKKLS